jgi:hypothetical protein
MRNFLIVFATLGLGLIMGAAIPVEPQSRPVTGSSTVSVTAIVPGTGATNLGKAEDGTPANGDVGVLGLCQVIATPAATATDAKYGVTKCNPVGAHYVQVVDAAGASVGVSDDCDGTIPSHKYYITAGSGDNESQVKATAGTFCSIVASNSDAAADAHIKCTNLTAANTTPGSSTIFYEILVPFGLTVTDAPHIPFSVAMTCYVVTGQAATDATDAASEDVTYSLRYR